jgi:hypothetical protein
MFMMFVPSAGTLARQHYTAFSSQVGTSSSLEKMRPSGDVD